MKTVILDPLPEEVGALIERRRRLGLDRYDEVWEGVYHMTPGPSGRHAYLDRQLAIVLEPYAEAAGLIGTSAFNLGNGPDDFRVPDGGYHRTMPTGAWIPTVAIVIEILSPGDETFDKFEFYGRHGVEEIIVVDSVSPVVRIWQHHIPTATFVEADRSALLGIEAHKLAGSIRWPND